MRRRDFLTGVSCCGLTASAWAQTPALPALPQAPKLDDTVASGFTRNVIIRWGDGVLPDAPPFNPAALTCAQADTQFPYDGVIAGLIVPPPAQDGIPRKVLVVATADAPARMLFPGGVDHPDIAMHEQGITVGDLEYLNGRWVLVVGGYHARRINDGALCQITGPASAPLGGAVQGVLGPRAGCATPWGSVLAGESLGETWLARLANTNAAQLPGAASFGWVIELEPLHPLAIPAKRTALGRIARAGLAAAQTKDGRPVVFFTQDDPAGFLFRFVAASNAIDGTALDTGTLAVARIHGSAIEWVDLGSDVPSLLALASTAAQAGASSFDAPGGLALTPDKTTLYLACRGNPARVQPNDLNPRPGDDNGHIIRFQIPDGDLTTRVFLGEIVLFAGPPATMPNGVDTTGSQVWLRQPRTVNLDDQGQLWIGTDQGGNTSQTADGLFTLPPAGAAPGAVQPVYLAPVGAAMGGTAFDHATGTIFSLVRHPGATPSASFAAPATRWPSLLRDMPPQSTVIGLVRKHQNEAGG